MTSQPIPPPADPDFKKKAEEIYRSTLPASRKGHKIGWILSVVTFLVLVFLVKIVLAQAVVLSVLPYILFVVTWYWAVPYKQETRQVRALDGQMPGFREFYKKWRGKMIVKWTLIYLLFILVMAAIAFGISWVVFEHY